MESIERWAEESEALKDRARRIGRDVAGRLDFQEVQRNPDDHMAYLIAILIALLEDDILPTAREEATRFADALGFENAPDADILDAAIAAAIASLENDLTAQADDWAQDLDDRLQALEDAAVSQSVYESATADGSAMHVAVVAELASIFATAAGEIVNVVGSEVYEEYSAENVDEDVDMTPRRWLTVHTSKAPSCDGPLEVACLPRHGLVKTLKEWEELGTPNSPNLRCVTLNDAEVCRCLMVPTKTNVPNPVSVSEAMARGRARGGSKG